MTSKSSIPPLSVRFASVVLMDPTPSKGRVRERSAGGLAAVDGQYLSGDERCFFGSEKDGGTRDVGRVADAPHRHCLQKRCFSLCGSREAFEHAGLDRTG